MHQPTRVLLHVLRLRRHEVLHLYLGSTFFWDRAAKLLLAKGGGEVIAICPQSSTTRAATAPRKVSVAPLARCGPRTSTKRRSCACGGRTRRAGSRRSPENLSSSWPGDGAQQNPTPPSHLAH